MQFAGNKLTQDDLRDVSKISRTKMYWVRLVMANWYGTALLLIVIWATAAGLVGQIHPNWRGVAAMWAVVVAIVLWSVYRTKRAQTWQLAQLNAILPDQVNLTTEGVKLDGPNGASGFVPWRNFKDWHEGQRVILVRRSDGNRAVILPIAHLSDVERAPVRQFLFSQIPTTK